MNKNCHRVLQHKFYCHQEIPNDARCNRNFYAFFKSFKVNKAAFSLLLNFIRRRDDVKVNSILYSMSIGPLGIFIIGKVLPVCQNETSQTFSNGTKKGDPGKNKLRKCFLIIFPLWKISYSIISFRFGGSKSLEFQICNYCWTQKALKKFLIKRWINFNFTLFSTIAKTRTAQNSRVHLVNKWCGDGVNS